MACQPEDDFDISPVPAVSKVMCKEAPWVVVVFVREEDAHTIITLRACVVIVSPDDAQVKRPGGCHDSNVWKRPAAVVVCERVDSLEEEGMAGNGAHGVVRDTSWDGTAKPCGVCEERVETTVTSL